MHEPWWTATARHADIVLPATTTLERNDIGSAHPRPFVIAMEKAIEPVGEARNDFDILRALAAALGCAAEFTGGRDETEWLRHLYAHWRESARTNEAAHSRFRRVLGRWLPGNPEGRRRICPLRRFPRRPRGHKLDTPSGSIELYSDKIASFGYADCPPYPTWIAPIEWLGEVADYPLHLVSSQPRHKLHSQMDQGPVSAAGKIAGREAVTLHPDDAAARGINDGDLVRVFITPAAPVSPAR